MGTDPRAVLFLLSLAAHGGFALAVGRIERPTRREFVPVTIRAARRAQPAPPPLPPPPAPVAAAASAPTPAASPRAPRTSAPARSAPARAARAGPASPAAPSAAPGPGGPDFGLSLTGGVGAVAVGSGGGGGGGGAEPAQSAARSPSPRETSDEPACDEAPRRARPVELDEPTFPDAAREAGIEGRVRVEITVDEQGRVAGTRVLQSLGYGCDEAALAVARAARFEPATRCGRPVRSTVTVGIRFVP